MYGNVEIGKTYLSIALGIEACKRGIPTRFFRTAALVNQLSEAKKSGTLSLLMKKILKADLIICDEWGYIPLDRTGAQLLFEVISECHERKAIILNTNLEFPKCVNIFYDEQMTSAILDRILHHCLLLLFPGQSNRMRESGLANSACLYTAFLAFVCCKIPHSQLRNYFCKTGNFPIAKNILILT
jgi:DNA replication protein DnaC